MKKIFFMAVILVLLNPLSAARCEEVVYVVNSYAHLGASGYPGYSTVMMLRASDLEILKTVQIPGPFAHTCVLTRDGCELWVSSPEAKSLVVIDTRSFEIIQTFDYSAGTSKPIGLAIEPVPTAFASPMVVSGMWDESILKFYNSGSLEGIPTAGAIPSGGRGEFLTFTPDGGRLCVVDVSDPSVTLWSWPSGDYIHQYDLAGTGLGHAVVSPNGTRLYVANKEENRIDCVSLGPPYEVISQNATISDYSGLIISRPRGIAISPDGNYLFTAHQIPGGSKVAMWRITPWAWIAEADLPENGRRIAVNSDCTRIYVADHDADKVYVYRVNIAGTSMFLAPPYTGRDLNTIPGYKASPVGITVGEWWDNIGVFRELSGLWALKGMTRAYFGRNGDIPVPGKYGAVGGPGIAVFRPSSGLWAIEGIGRDYFGNSSDIPVPADYDGDGFDDIAIFRPSSGLWAVLGGDRSYFGRSGDQPVPADYDGDGTDEIAIFRESSGLWANPTQGRMYFGSNGDIPVPGEYLASWIGDAVGIFRPSSGLWAINDGARVYFGRNGDEPVQADFNGDGKNDYAVFRESSGLWAVRDVTRAYFGAGSDIPVTR